MKDIKIEGFCDERFEKVKKAFERNFKENLDVGASFAATLNGEYIIDIWGEILEQYGLHPQFTDH
jgi:hypothetical protein